MIHASFRPLLLVALICLAGCNQGSSSIENRKSRIEDQPNLPGIAPAMEQFVAQGQISGAVTLVASPDRILHLNALGQADIAAATPMRIDTIFWIASMTKPVTGTAVCMMHDQGKLSVNDPVAKYIPEFAALKTPDGKPANITIRHLLTHTSGLADVSREQERSARTLADLIPYIVSAPLRFEPGSRWQYCQSSINTAARIVEIVSGQSFPDFVQQRLFEPLGMKDTTFYPTQAQLARIAKPYKSVDGKLDEAPNHPIVGPDPTLRTRYPAANGGLFSTAGDYARFCQMILNGGELDGRRYLSAAAVQLMTSVQSGEVKTGFTEGNGWGLGWCVVRQPQGVTAVLSPGSFGHGGAYGTQAWIDPNKQRIYLLMVQRSNFPNADASPVRQAFQEAATAALK